MNIRDVAKDVVPPILARSIGRLRRHEIPHTSPSEAETVIHSFSSIEIGSYSQYGEDLVLDAVMGCPSSGFFVDVGANDPVSLSNTKRFSVRGWKGINVEPNPVAFARIKEDRPLDINLNFGVGTQESRLTFYNMDPDTLSTFDEEVANHSISLHKGARVLETTNVPVIKLSSLFHRYLPRNTLIDFLSMDIEGGELDGLKGNDWDIFRPKWIMIEVVIAGSRIFDFLSTAGYGGMWSNGTNALFVDRRLRLGAS